jgi:hypothetical protein
MVIVKHDNVSYRGSSAVMPSHQHVQGGHCHSIPDPNNPSQSIGTFQAPPGVGPNIEDLVEAAVHRRLNKSEDHIAHLQAEIDHWKQMYEELEIEMLMLENAYDTSDTDILPKHRGIF